MYPLQEQTGKGTKIALSCIIPQVSVVFVLKGGIELVNLVAKTLLWELLVNVVLLTNTKYVQLARVKRYSKSW